MFPERDLLFLFASSALLVHVISRFADPSTSTNAQARYRINLNAEEEWFNQ
jgi:hypothetical protein